MIQERKTRLAIVFVCFLLFVGIIVDAFSHFKMVNSVISIVTRPFTFIVGGTARGIHSISDFFTLKSTLENENKALKKENDQLRQTNVELIAMKAENERLAKLLKFKNLHPEYETMSAKIISRDLGDFKDVILIDKGSEEGLRVNMPVVNAAGLIGIIDAVYPHISKVLLISSPRSSLGGMNLRGDSRAAGIVNGVAGPDLSLEMRNLARNADVLPGDTIVTSGYTGYHPEGLVIGTVEDVQMDPGGLTKTATIVPSVDYTHLEEALVITNYAGFADFLRQQGKNPDIRISKGGKNQ
jgi:rod shape-determining protein MreC